MRAPLDPNEFSKVKLVRLYTLLTQVVILLRWVYVFLNGYQFKGRPPGTPITQWARDK